MPDPLPPSRSERLTLLLTESKTFDDELYLVPVNALIETMAKNQARYLTKNAVLTAFRLTMKACRKANDNDKQRICDWFERIMEIQGLSDSEGLLDRWLSGVPL